jgi:DNA recombination protein RmuC
MTLAGFSVIALLLIVLLSLILVFRALSRLTRSLSVAGLQAALITEFQTALSGAVGEMRKASTETDQGLRTALAEAMKDALVTAFDRVQAGAQAQTAELARFGATMREDMAAVTTGVATLADKVTADLNGTTTALSDRLNAAELAAAEGRTILLRDTAAAIVRARDEIDLALKKFGGEQETRLGALDVTVKEGGEAVQSVLGAFRNLVIERVDLASQATATSLKEFGDQQGLRLEGIAKTVKDGGDASQLSLGEFRKEVADRLDAVALASTALLEKAAGTFTDIQAAITASEGRTSTALAEQHLAVLSRLSQGQLEVSEKLARELGDLMKQVKDGFEAFAAKLREEQEQLRGLVGTKLDEMRTGNEVKLEDMRKAVDEKLQGALEKQVGESFQRIAEQFAAVQQAIGQVQSVAGQVGDLRRLFSNVKSRGGWGEAQAEAMLQDMLPVGAYQKNMRMQEGSGEFVEFAVRIPGKDKTEKWVAIDSKFPTEDYERLLTANEQGNRDEETLARTALERRIRQEAERIGSKYIASPKTVDFAVLYLPSDSLFAEVARSPGLIEVVRRDHKILVMGPSLLPAFLHTINVGYMTMALERNAAEIGETLSAVKTEWGKLLPWLEKIGDRTDTLKKGIEEVQRRARAVGRKLRMVDVIDHDRAEAVLGLDSPTFVQDALDEANDESPALTTI